jgi:hypothetical protein
METARTSIATAASHFLSIVEPPGAHDGKENRHLQSVREG